MELSSTLWSFVALGCCIYWSFKIARGLRYYTSIYKRTFYILNRIVDQHPSAAPVIAYAMKEAGQKYLGIKEENAP